MKNFILITIFLFSSIAFGQATKLGQYDELTTNDSTLSEITILKNIDVDTNGGVYLPSGTTAERPTPSKDGLLRYNNQTDQAEIYANGTWQPVGGGISNWVTAKSYLIDDVVIENQKIYQCITNHTSGTFATDLASGYWEEVSGVATLQISYNNSVAPQITTSTSLGSVDIRRGSDADTDNIFRGQNGSGSTTFAITGNGAVTASGAITGSNLSGTNTGDLKTSGENDTTVSTSEIVVPNKQITLVNTNKYRVESGNFNELINPSFEHSTVETGWTIVGSSFGVSNSTMDGKQSIQLNVSVMTGPVDFSQSSTINSAQKSGVQMMCSMWINSTNISDLRLCSLKNGVEDKCTASGGYTQGTGWRQLIVSFLGDSTSNGCKLKSTDNTGEVLVDNAYLGVGSPIVDFTPDMVFSAKISSGGVVSDENTDWINGGCVWSPTGTATCTFTSGIFSVVPNCTVSSNINESGILTGTTSTTVQIYSATSPGTAVNSSMILICQKQGADYKTSKAYVASGSLALNTTVYSAKISGTTASDLNVAGWITSVAQSGNNQVKTLTIPSGIFSNVPNCQCTINEATTATDISCKMNVGASTATSLVFHTSSNGAAAAQNPIITCQKQGADYTTAFNPVIVGSFQGYNETPGTSRVETFSVKYGAGSEFTACSVNGNCTLYKQIGNGILSVARTGIGLYTITFSKNFNSVNCIPIPTGVDYLSGQVNAFSSGSNTLTFQSGKPGATQDSFGTIFCQGIPQ